MADPQPPDLTITQGEVDRLKAKLAAIPPGKTGALIIGLDWRGGVPVWGRVGVATRVGDHLQLSAEAETRFKKAAPNAGIYAALTWLLLMAVAPLSAADDRFHRVPLARLATTRWTHACTVGPVVYVRKQADGDIHITLDDGVAKVVLEIIRAVPLPVPRKGQRIDACGITRIDRGHRTQQYPAGWPELHPLLSWQLAK